MALEVSRRHSQVVRDLESPKPRKREQACDLFFAMGFGDDRFARPRGGVRGRRPPAVVRMTEKRAVKLGFVPQMSDTEADAAAEAAAAAAVEPAPPIINTSEPRPPIVLTPRRPILEVFDGDKSLR